MSALPPKADMNVTTSLWTAVAGHCALVHRVAETTFVLVRTNKSRGGGDDDYDVCDGEKVIGRIARYLQAPKKAPCFWTIIAEGRKRSLSDRGYAVSREQAMARN